MQTYIIRKDVKSLNNVSSSWYKGKPVECKFLLFLLHS